jgi:hypothetical protein
MKPSETFGIRLVHGKFTRKLDDSDTVQDILKTGRDKEDAIQR